MRTLPRTRGNLFISRILEKGKDYYNPLLIGSISTTPLKVSFSWVLGCSPSSDILDCIQYVTIITIQSTHITFDQIL